MLKKYISLASICIGLVATAFLYQNCGHPELVDGLNGGTDPRPPVKAQNLALVLPKAPDTRVDLTDWLEEWMFVGLSEADWQASEFDVDVKGDRETNVVYTRATPSETQSVVLQAQSLGQVVLTIKRVKSAATLASADLKIFVMPKEEAEPAGGAILSGPAYVVEGAQALFTVEADTANAVDCSGDSSNRSCYRGFLGVGWDDGAASQVFGDFGPTCCESDETPVCKIRSCIGEGEACENNGGHGVDFCLGFPSLGDNYLWAEDSDDNQLPFYAQAYGTDATDNRGRLPLPHKAFVHIVKEPVRLASNDPSGANICANEDFESFNIVLKDETSLNTAIDMESQIVPTECVAELLQDFTPPDPESHPRATGLTYLVFKQREAGVTCYEEDFNADGTLKAEFLTDEGQVKESAPVRVKNCKLILELRSAADDSLVTFPRALRVKVAWPGFVVQRAADDSLVLKVNDDCRWHQVGDVLFNPLALTNCAAAHDIKWGSDCGWPPRPDCPASGPRRRRGNWLQQTLNGSSYVSEFTWPASHSSATINFGTPQSPVGIKNDNHLEQDEFLAFYIEARTRDVATEDSVVIKYCDVEGGGHHGVRCPAPSGSYGGSGARVVLKGTNDRRREWPDRSRVSPIVKIVDDERQQSEGRGADGSPFAPALPPKITEGSPSESGNPLLTTRINGTKVIKFQFAGMTNTQGAPSSTHTYSIQVCTQTTNTRPAADANCWTQKCAGLAPNGSSDRSTNLGTRLVKLPGNEAPYNFICAVSAVASRYYFFRAKDQGVDGPGDDDSAWLYTDVVSGPAAEAE